MQIKYFIGSLIIHYKNINYFYDYEFYAVINYLLYEPSNREVITI